MTDREQKKQQILSRLDCIIDEVEQMIRDIEWWNNNRLDCAPMDCEHERVLIPLLRKAKDAFDSEDRQLQAELWPKIMESMKEF